MDYNEVSLEFGQDKVMVNIQGYTPCEIRLTDKKFTLQKLIDSLDKIKDMAIVGVKKD